MDDEIEDIVGDIKYTDSQKSVATSNVYSLDFTDSCSEKNNSSGKDTYVIEWDDSEDSDAYSLHGNKSVMSIKDKSATPAQVHRDKSATPAQVHRDKSATPAQVHRDKSATPVEIHPDKYAMPVQVHRATDIQCDVTNRVSRAVSTSFHNYSILTAQEIFTQTSRTMFDGTESDMRVKKETLETQTSFISVTENNTIEYRIEVSGSHKNFSRNQIRNNLNELGHCYDCTCNKILTNSLEDGSSKFPISDTETVKTGDSSSNNSSDDRIIKIIDEDSKENVLSEERNEMHYENTSDFDQLSTDSNVEEDSLIEPNCHQRKTDHSDSQSDSSEVPKSVDNDVEELYNKLSESIDLHTFERSCELESRRLGTLTPLTEEATMKQDSLIDISPNIKKIDNPIGESDEDILFTNNAGIKIKLSRREDNAHIFKLPPIKNQSCPNSPHLNFLFSVHHSNKLNKSGTLPSLDEGQNEKFSDRWEIGTKDLASGESPLITERDDVVRSNQIIHLPPIHVEGYIINNSINKTSEAHKDPICINEKIKHLKMSSKTIKQITQNKYNISKSESRSGSPSSTSPDEYKLCDAAEKGSEALCVEILRKLRSSSWFEVTDTLEEVPGVLDKFWRVIAEQRVVDLIRQVSAHIESPRTQVVCSACSTLASIVKNTNYTKKPDFYEAVTALLAKTGSYSRPIRRAANVALDDIVCSVELTHAITALCIHGVGHKSALVRCASARLLVVCCAMGGGGRDVMRARPPTAACARRHALRSLAALLGDKNTDARKYAERLYSMLRPLANFEAYYLTDVDVELASRQMRKYDRLLLCGPHKETRCSNWMKEQTMATYLRFLEVPSLQKPTVTYNRDG